MTENGNGLLKRAEDAGWVYRLRRSPLVVFRPPMTRLITAIRELLMNEVAQPYSFEEYIFPRIVPEGVLAKTGWLSHHRPEAWFVDPKQEFVYKPDEEGSFFTDDPFPSEPVNYALDPIQCVSLYYALYDRVLDPSKLPIKAVEYQGGWTHRREKETKGLWRSIEFLRLEFVWVGKRDQVIQIRDNVLQKAGDTLADSLRLDVKFAEGDSCFVEPSAAEYANIVCLDKLNELGDAASVDIVLKCEGNWQELASATRYKQIAPRFKIKLAGSTEAPWTGCMGIGITRLAAAFLEAHGFDPDEWLTQPLKRLFDRARV